MFNYTSQTDDGWYSDIPNFINDTGTYTISINNKSLTGNWAVYFINSSKQRVGDWIKASSSVSTPSTFTVTTEQANAPYIRILPNASGLHDIENYNIMVNEGTTALPYEPYGTNWYIEKNIGKYNAWTSVNRSSTYTNTISYQFVLPTPTDSTKRAYVLCNYFQNAINNNDNEHIFIGTNITNVYAGLNVFISKTRATTNEEAISWLKNNGVEVYYVLNTPTYEIITNENLIQQLNNLQNIELIENLCYVDWVGSIAPTMLLQYPTNETLNAYLITEDNKLIRTDWRFIGRRK